jgi:hypothetical protein
MYLERQGRCKGGVFADPGRAKLCTTQLLVSLFLSTTGKISQFTSAIDEDLSKRVVEGKLVIIQPYTDLGFDPLANILDLDGFVGSRPNATDRWRL